MRFDSPQIFLCLVAKKETFQDLLKSNKQHISAEMYLRALSNNISKLFLSITSHASILLIYMLYCVYNKKKVVSSILIIIFLFRQKKIVLNGKSADKLKDLHSKGKNLGVPCHLVKDAGHTEIAPGSITVLACFGLEENVNKITGSLRLLK